MTVKNENGNTAETEKKEAESTKKSTKKTTVKKTPAEKSQKTGFGYCSKCGSRQKINGKCKICDKK